ncbi:uroporphyrinogen-III synthase [Anaplasma centrale]|nr:uroporphyrinogen-III synthase [Anaplasma centrale]
MFAVVFRLVSVRSVACSLSREMGGGGSVGRRGSVFCSCHGRLPMGMLVLTRASADSAKSKGALEELGFDVFVEPMFEVVHLRTEALKLQSYDVTVVTSRNGVDVIAKLTDERDICILTVGDSTMKRATALGFTNVVSAGGTVRDVVSCLNAYQRGTKVLYARGEEVSYDLRGAAEKMGFEVEEAVLYKVVARANLSPQCCDLLMNGEILGVVFYSTRTAKIFTELSRQYSRLLRNVCAYSMSSGVFRALDVGAWKRILVSRRPTEESLFKLLLGIERS